MELSNLIYKEDLNNGATGPTGPKCHFDVGVVLVGDDPKVSIEEQNDKEVLNFTLPKGVEGPTGPAGTSVSILGSYNSYDELVADHPTGNNSDSYLVNGDLYVWSDNESDWINVGNIKGPQGDVGPTGPTGPSKISAAYLVSFNGDHYSLDGLEVRSDERLPIMREEIDTDGLVDLDTSANVVQFSKIGYYKITFVVDAYVPYFGDEFDPKIDFVTIGFRLVGTDDVFIGSSQWIYDESPLKLTAQGIITVNNISNAYELVNLTNRSIYLNSPKLENIKSGSYFTNAPITIIIEYLGR